MTPEQTKELIVRELPAILEKDPDIHRFFIELSRRHFPDKTRTEDRFDRILDEMRRDRESQSLKWEEQNRKWEEQNRKWEEQNRKWEANQQVINEMLKDISALSRKHDTTIGALGARWGLHTEQAFREALKGILEDFENVEVINVLEYDDEGVVFGRPDQIELDLIVKNGLLIIAEIKSSMSKPEMYIFERKARFYEKRHHRQADKMIVISPMVAPNAVPVAEKLGIVIYTAAQDFKV